jgi:SAM-dependent methyltransferase
MEATERHVHPSPQVARRPVTTLTYDALVLREEQDSYGRAMLDYLQGRPGDEIVERDDGFIYVGAGPDLYFAPYPRWRAHEKRAMRYVRGRVLDVGCGAGRALLRLRELGLDAHGIDISPLAVEVCRRRGLTNVEVRSIAELDGLGSFDTILLLGSGFGLFGSRAGARRLLRRMRSMTPDAGRVVATTRDPYTGRDDAPYIERNVARGRMPGQFRIRIRYRTYRGPWFDYLTVSREELVEVVDGTGWSATRFFDGPAGRYAAVLDRAR